MYAPRFTHALAPALGHLSDATTDVARTAATTPRDTMSLFLSLGIRTTRKQMASPICIVVERHLSQVGLGRVELPTSRLSGRFIRT